VITSIKEVKMFKILSQFIINSREHHDPQLLSPNAKNTYEVVPFPSSFKHPELVLKEKYPTCNYLVVNRGGSQIFFWYEDEESSNDIKICKFNSISLEGEVVFSVEYGDEVTLVTVFDDNYVIWRRKECLLQLWRDSKQIHEIELENPSEISMTSDPSKIFALNENFSPFHIHVKKEGLLVEEIYDYGTIKRGDTYNFVVLNDYRDEYQILIGPEELIIFKDKYLYFHDLKNYQLFYKLEFRSSTSFVYWCFITPDLLFIDGIKIRKLFKRRRSDKKFEEYQDLIIPALDKEQLYSAGRKTCQEIITLPITRHDLIEKAKFLSFDLLLDLKVEVLTFLV
jgi:hypothetical protein